MAIGNDLEMTDQFVQSAEPSAVQYGPVNVAMRIDAADAVRIFINTMDLLQGMGLLAENDTPSSENTAAPVHFG